ncbi:MAG: Eco57I restriction-modification methylase domain-containing protein [Nostoc sp. NOS(2021)]|uniref:Eco57I restriction-modification methylase domain-containing protein n=1 Tax=Nostoc sp. NOS(2021) TaxID=2815407 RepID=UPI0025E71E0E|nr:Eco57I restriction-modification methylase domain-containing protein [Nostoc sp. NOS(2021)]MBN3894709.1 Eco57I restriction-modification methylase domain-containing protein [Nostoc sp. NOS(2021)]
MLTFISSNKWFRAKYGEKLRKHIADSCHVESITDFGDLPVFKSAAVLVMIFISQNGKNTTSSSNFTQVTSLKPPYPNVLEIIQENGHILANDAFKSSDWMLTDANYTSRIRKMESAGVPLGEYVNGQIYYGIKTGFNKAFIIDGTKRAELINKDSKSAKILNLLAVGDDVRQWRIESKNRWLIVTRTGINIKRYPAIFTHLKQWQDELEKRSDKGNFWWELRACDYYAAFYKPKIIYPVIAKEKL